jgi:hypothetical protein
MQLFSPPKSATKVIEIWSTHGTWVLMSPPSLCRVEPGSEHGDGGDFNGCSAAS